MPPYHWRFLACFGVFRGTKGCGLHVTFAACKEDSRSSRS